MHSPVSRSRRKLATATSCDRDVARPGPTIRREALFKAGCGHCDAPLQRPEGATVDEVASVMGWQRHTVRGLFSGTLKKKLGLTLASATEERGRRLSHRCAGAGMSRAIQHATGCREALARLPKLGL